MPLFLVHCADKPDALELRLSVRPAHLAWLEAEKAVVRLGGARLSDEAEPKPVGSTLVIEVENLAAARAWAAKDPYAQAGLFASTDIQQYRAIVGDWLPQA